jgi:1,4-dihydroxy-2-naphthoate octaprenyltransferase
VILGEQKARQVTRGMFVAFYAFVVVLVVAEILPVFTLAVFLSVPLFLRVWAAFGEPKPDVSPVPNPVWPLWFAPHAFLLTRRAGGLLLLGMIAGAIFGF